MAHPGRGLGGVVVGEIAKALDLPETNLYFHLMLDLIGLRRLGFLYSAQKYLGHFHRLLVSFLSGNRNSFI